METIEQLVHIIEELERKVNVALEKTYQLQRASEKALDTAMHAYTLDEYGYLWTYDAETKTYRKTKMRVATPEIINEAIKAKHIAEGAITGDKVEAGAVVPGKIADDAVQTRNIKDGNVTFDKLDETTKNIVITGGGQHGIPLSPEFGDSDVLGISQKTLTESRDDLLARIENVQVREQSDWEQTDEQAPTYIKNKPNIPPSAIVDPVPTRNSPNSVASGGVFDALQAQDAITASFSNDGKIYHSFKAGDIFYVEQDGVHKYRVAYVDGIADEEHPITIDGLRFYFANNAADSIFKSILVKNVSTVQQQLTSTQKSTARENIAAVAYEKQELTSAQQVQLQNNMMGKEYAPADFSGLGKKVFAKNVQAVGGVNKNIMTQAFFEDEQGNPLTNTVFVIQYDYELVEDVTIPANSVLQFDGGSISGAYTLSLNNCSIEAQGYTIFGETVKIKGLRYARASWFGIFPANVGSDSGSSKFIHFCASPDCDGFELEFDRGDYRFAFHGVLLNKYMKLKGSKDKSTRWFIAIDAPCAYVIGVNRHCSVSNLDIRLSSRDNQTGADFFRVSNEWSDDEDAADSMKVNYDYSFDTIWLKGVYESGGDYTNSMNGIAIRIRDKQEGSSTLNKVLFAEGPQHCENVMIEMVRAGIVFEVYSDTIDVAWANGFEFKNIFVQGHIGFESLVNNHSSSGKNYIVNFQYQGRPNTHGLYGCFNGDFVVNHQSHDTYKFGTAKGEIFMSNCNFSDSGDNPYTDLKNGFKPYDDEYPRITTIPYKVNELYLTPTTARPSDGVLLHKLDYSEPYKRVWKPRTDQNNIVEEYIDNNSYIHKRVITGNVSEEKINSYNIISAFYMAGIAKKFIVDWKRYISGYANYQDGAFIKAYTDYGFKLSMRRLNSGSFEIGDVLSFIYTFGFVQGVEDNMSTKLLYIKNIFATAGEVAVRSIEKSTTAITLRGVVKINKSGSLANDGLGLEYKILEPLNDFTDETQTLWANEKYTEELTVELLHHSKGATADRPTSGLYVGMQYFDTSIEKPIWYKGNSVWVDATGATV